MLSVHCRGQDTLEEAVKAVIDQPMQPLELFSQLPGEVKAEIDTLCPADFGKDFTPLSLDQQVAVLTSAFRDQAVARTSADEMEKGAEEDSGSCAQCADLSEQLSRSLTGNLDMALPTSFKGLSFSSPFDEARFKFEESV